MINLLYREGQLGVDRVARAWAERVRISVTKHINIAGTTCVTSLVDTIRVRCIADVTSGSESPFISFHNVEFGTQAALVVGSTIFEWVAIVVHSWHENIVQSSDAPTASLA